MTSNETPAGGQIEQSVAQTRVLLVDDQELLRSSFQMLLDSQEDMVVIASAANGAAALEIMRERIGEIDIVLLDMRMPVMDGLGVLRAARHDPLLARLPVLVLTTFDQEYLILGALRAGARGFMLKDASPAVLLEAVRTVAAGGSWLDPAITSTVLAHLGEDQDAAPTKANVIQGALNEALTQREHDVLALVCEGVSNRDIAERLFLAESTVKTHVKAILGKTSCSNRVELIVHAYRTGLATVD